MHFIEKAMVYSRSLLTLIILTVGGFYIGSLIDKRSQ